MDVTITVPKMQFVSQTPEQVAQTLKLYAALGMYRAGMMSIGAACELAGYSIHDFHTVLKAQSIEIQTDSADEFEQAWRSHQLAQITS